MALHFSTDVDWEATYLGIKQIIVETFATLHSLALQQTLYEMGKAVLETYDFIAEIRFSAPNKHHFVYNLEPRSASRTTTRSSTRMIGPTASSKPPSSVTTCPRPPRPGTPTPASSDCSAGAV